MDVLNLLELRTTYPLKSKEPDTWICDLINFDENDVSIIATESSFRVTNQNKEYLDPFLKKYKLKAMFDLKNPYAGIGIRMFLYVFTKGPCSKIKYGIYKKDIPYKSKTQDKSGQITLPDEYPETYFEYFDNIERFVNDNECPSDTDYQEFGYINAECRDDNVWNPNRYNKQAVNIQKALHKENTVLLSTIASIISPRRTQQSEKLQNCYLSSANWTYPVDYNKLKDGYKTDYSLKKGDILVINNINNVKMFLIYENPPKEIYPSPMACIIRPTKISPEYLYLYLKSETMQIIFQSMQSGCMIPRIKMNDIKNIPVIVPKDDINNYEKLFYLQSFSPKTMDEYDELLSKLKRSDNETLEGILNTELVDNLRIYKSSILNKFLKEDIEELNICFKHKAYKATLILAGSILEAILIDWLSENDNENYFEKDYIKNGHKANLGDYIDKIKYLKKPHWYSEAYGADKIRENRNLVHAKLCLKKNVKIDENLCLEVVQYLKDVIKSRNDIRLIKTKKKNANKKRKSRKVV